MAVQGETCQNFIGGEWRESKAGRRVERRNPADTDELVAIIPQSSREETREAIDAAVGAWPAWRETPAPARGRVLFRAMSLMEGQKESLAQTLTREEGKAIRDSRGEVQKAINILEYMAGEGRRLAGETLPSELPRNFSYVLKQPIGVAGLITPWNFPVSIPVWKLAPALVSGNTVVFKPATLTPLTAMRVVEIFQEAGLPAGVLNLVHGAGGEVGDEMVIHPSVRALSFTGSNSVGTALYTAGAERLKKCQCEMGGKNPLVVLKDADLELAAESAAFGAFASTGQRCTATSRVILEECIADRFIHLLTARTRTLVTGNGLSENVDVGPAVDETQMETDLRYMAMGKREAELVLGGERLSGGDYEHGWFVSPTIFDHVQPHSPLAQEEIFGPVLSLVRVRDFEEALEVANSVKFGLSSSLYSNDAAKIFEFIDKIEAGITHINSPTVGGEAHLPFGGVKSTGVGAREMGRAALDFYTELKTVYVDYTGRQREGSLY